MKKQMLSLIIRGKSKSAIIRIGIVVCVLAVVLLSYPLSSHLVPVEAAAPTCTRPLNGLVAWYPGEDPANSNIGCLGAGCVPEIKGANTGTARAGTTYAAGKVGQAFQFSTNNGSASTQVNVPDSPSLRLTNGLTIEAWINPTAPGVADNPILVKGNLSSANNQPYSILFVNAGAGDNRIIFRVGNTSTFDSLVSSNIPLNTYTHVACTYDGTTMSIYVNGVSDASKSTTIGTLNQNNLPLSIGGGTADFAGAVDELGIYNVALGQSDIQAIVTADSAGKCRSGSTFPAQPFYSAGEDFSVWANPSPLNGGVWSYGSAASLGAPFTLYTNPQTSVGGGTYGNGYIDGWAAASNTPPAVFYNTSNSTQTYSSTVSHPAGLLSLQPGSCSFVRWTAPSIGEYILQGQFSGIETTGTTTDVYIIRNYGTASQTTYFSGFINGYSTSPGGNAPFFLDFVARNAGDTIDFIVGPGTNAGTGETSPVNDSTGLVAYFFKQNSNLPTAAGSIISGQIATSDGTPLSGTTVTLKGTESRRTITDSNGNYRFENVETGGFYTVTPSRANFSFDPGTRSFSLIANKPDADFAAQPASSQTQSPLDTDLYFVRQQYIDFLDREPDAGGFGYWSAQFDACNADASCLRRTRINVSAAFFIEQEFQQTGSFIYRLYKAAYGARPSYAQFTSDRSRVIGGASLDANKAQFADEFITRAEFKAQYPDSLSNADFVNNLFDRAGLAGYQAERQSYTNALNSGGTRSQVLRGVIESAAFKAQEYDRAFVLMQYFGYLRRDPDEGGYQFWLDVLNNREAQNYRGMVCSFITSTEYQKRFSSVVSHSNAECGR